MKEAREKENQHAIAEEIFQTSSKIRWFALVNREVGLTMSRTRDDSDDYVPSEEERMFAEIRAPFILEAANHSPREGDSLDYVEVRFERTTTLIVPLRTSYLIVTAENDLSVGERTEIVRRIRNLANKNNASVGSVEILSLLTPNHARTQSRTSMF